MPHGHGGKRTGAGRPRGSINKFSAEVREAAVAGGESPLDYMCALCGTRKWIRTVAISWQKLPRLMSIRA